MWARHTFFVAILFQAPSCLAPPPPQPTTLNNFRIFRGTGPGEFNPQEEALLVHYVEEAGILAASGAEAINTYHEDGPSRKAIAAFFGVHPNPQPDGSLNPDVDSLNVLRSYLNGASIYANGVSKNTGIQPLPIFFNGDTWLERQTWDTVVRDVSSGQPVPNGQSLKDRFPEKYKELTVDETSVDNEGRPKVHPPTEIPYWSDKMRDYIFDKDYGPNRGFCSMPGYQAGTMDQLKVFTTTFCFQNIQARNGAINQVPPLVLGQDNTGSPVTWRVRRALAPYIPQSVAVLHEFFHYIDIEQSYPDHQGVQGSLSAMLYHIERGDPAQARESRNEPETLAYFCVAAWFRYQEYRDGNTIRQWEFSLGSASLVEERKA